MIRLLLEEPRREFKTPGVLIRLDHLLESLVFLFEREIQPSLDDARSGEPGRDALDADFHLVKFVFDELSAEQGAVTEFDHAGSGRVNVVETNDPEEPVLRKAPNLPIDSSNGEEVMIFLDDEPAEFLISINPEVDPRRYGG